MGEGYEVGVFAPPMALPCCIGRAVGSCLTSGQGAVAPVVLLSVGLAVGIGASKGDTGARVPVCTASQQQEGIRNQCCRLCYCGGACVHVKHNMTACGRAQHAKCSLPDIVLAAFTSK